MSYCNVEDLFVRPEDSLRHVMERINVTLRAIALVVDPDRKLLGTVVDGDIRRALLANMPLDSTVADVLRQKDVPQPVQAPLGASSADLITLMHDRSVHQVPLVDADGRVADLVTMDDLLPDEVLPLKAVIMAGGVGARLKPLTEQIPKPMLPVGGRPVLELIVDSLREAGIRHVNVTTHYKPEAIKEHFGDGNDFGVELHYLTEDRPLGTAGALGLMERPQETVLVMNGDILTDIDFRAMLGYHREHKAVLTLAVRKYEIAIPYGVVECDGAQVSRLVEKPHLAFFVNAGIYLLEPEAHGFIPDNERFDMTDLIRSLLDAGRPVASFPVHEYWLDIGQPNDYQKAQDDVKNGSRRLA
jgi:dTDP-glucose pyrophosphorylase/CBS domain-containing protein